MLVPRPLFARSRRRRGALPAGQRPDGRGACRRMRATGTAPSADLVGPFLCPASRIDELVDDAAARPEHRSRSGLRRHRRRSAPGAAARPRPMPRIRSSPSRPRMTASATTRSAVGGNLDGTPPRPSLPRGPAHRLRVRPRPGGRERMARREVPHRRLTPDAFPTEGELAAFLRAVAGRGSPFKLTAGLHHAVRTTSRQAARAARAAQRPDRDPGGGDGGGLEAVAVRAGAARAPVRSSSCVQGWDDGHVRRRTRSVPVLRVLRRDRPARRALRTRTAGGPPHDDLVGVPDGIPVPAHEPAVRRLLARR